MVSLWPYAALLPQEAGVPGVHHTLPVDAAGTVLCRCHFQAPHLSHTPLWARDRRRLKGGKSRETNMKGGGDSAFCLIVMRHFGFSLHTHYRASLALGFRATRGPWGNTAFRMLLITDLRSWASSQKDHPLSTRDLSGSKKVTLKHLFSALLFQIINLEKRWKKHLLCPIPEKVSFNS